MSNIKTNHLARIILALLCVGGITSPRAEPLFLGSVAMQVPIDMHDRLTPLAAYLTEKTGQKVQFRAAPDLKAAVEDLGAGRTQIAYLTPAAYIDAHEKYGVIPLVAPLTKGKPYLTLSIVVRNNSPLFKPADLRGRRFAFGDERALLQRATVTGSGIALEEFSNYGFLKHYDNIIKAVKNGDFDAGIVIDRSVPDAHVAGLRVIYESPQLPSYVFGVTPAMPLAVFQKLQRAMISMRADTPTDKTILSALDPAYDGFVVVHDSYFDSARKLIEPYKKSLTKIKSAP